MNSMNNFSVNVYAKLKDKKSSAILQELTKFINFTFDELSDRVGDMSEISVAVQDFILKLVSEFAKTWEVEFTNNRNAYAEICEGFEGLIMKSLYSQIMECFGDDLKLEKLYRKYSFITLKHLGIDLSVDDFELATQIKSKIINFNCLDFSEISQYKSPKEKLIVIVNFCNYICSKYKLTEKLIIIKFIAFSLLKANIQNLKGNLRFIALFRHKTVINSEEDYFLSIIFQTIEFLEKLNHSHLKINKIEFSQFCDEFDKKEILKIQQGKNLEDNMVNLVNKHYYEENLTQNKNKTTEPILENANDGILNLNLDQLYNEYCSTNFNEMPLSKFENMYNDFKIVLKIVESVKNEYKNGEATVINVPPSNSLSSSKNSLIDY